MVSSGLDPWDDDEQPLPVRVPRERLAEFDRVASKGGLDAIIESLGRNPNERSNKRNC
jgi:hypothetical protein